MRGNIRTIAIRAGVVALSALLIVLLVAMIATRNKLSYVEQRVMAGQAQTGYQPRTSAEKQAMEEFDDADRDSGYITRTIAMCHGIDNIDLIQGSGRYFLEMTYDIPPALRAQSRSIDLTGLDRAILQLDWRLKIERWRTYKNALEAQNFSWWIQFAIILIGAASTIAVALKSIQTFQASMSIGIIAIALSAAATAFSSYNSFTAPASVAASAQQRVAILRSIHQRLVQTFQQYYSGPLCPLAGSQPTVEGPKPTVTPPGPSTRGSIKGTKRPVAATSAAPGARPTEPKPPAASSSAYGKMMEELGKLKDEYLATLQAAPAQGGESGKGPAGTSPKK